MAGPFWISQEDLQFINEDVRRAQERRQKSSFLFGLNTRESRRQAWWISSYPFEFFWKVYWGRALPLSAQFLLILLGQEYDELYKSRKAFRGRLRLGGRKVRIVQMQSMSHWIKVCWERGRLCFKIETHATCCKVQVVTPLEELCVLTSSSLVWNRIKNTMRWG